MPRRIQRPGMFTSGDGSTLSLDFTSGVLDPRFTFTRNSIGTYTNSSGIVTTMAAAASNDPTKARFDYDPTTLAARGLLIEGAATNLFYYSNPVAITGAYWGAGGYTLGTGAISPDGTNTSTRFTVNSNSGATCSMQQTVTMNATSCTFSIWFKNGNLTGSSSVALTSVAVRNATTATILLRFYFNATNPTSITYVTGSSGASVVAYPNGWYRISATVTSGITSGNSITGYFAGLGSGISGELNNYADWWGPQMEQGTAASSFIPTSSSTGQRAADSCVMSGTNFSSWFSATQGTLIATWSGIGTTSGRYATINDGSASNQIWVGYSESAIYNGSFQASFGTAGTASGKVALAYATNDAAWCFNGAAVSTDTSVTLPTGLNQIAVGNSQAGTAPINTSLRSIKYFPTRLANATLQIITT
jgi:hypothetical protein